MATSINVRYGVPEVRDKVKSPFKAHLVIEEMFKVGASGKPDNGRILVSVVVDRGFFGSPKVCVLSKFGGDTTQKLDAYKGRPDSMALNLHVKDAVVEVRGEGNVTIDSVTHKPVSDGNTPQGVVAKKSDFFVKAEGPLLSVTAYLATLDKFIGNPAIEVLAAAVKELVSLTTGWKAPNGNGANGHGNGGEQK